MEGLIWSWRGEENDPDLCWIYSIISFINFINIIDFIDIILVILIILFGLDLP